MKGLIVASLYKAMAEPLGCIVPTPKTVGVLPSRHIVTQEALRYIQKRDLLVDVASSAFLAGAIFSLAAASTLLASITTREVVLVAQKVANQHLACRAPNPVRQRLLAASVECHSLEQSRQLRWPLILGPATLLEAHARRGPGSLIRLRLKLCELSCRRLFKRRLLRVQSQERGWPLLQTAAEVWSVCTSRANNKKYKQRAKHGSAAHMYTPNMTDAFYESVHCPLVPSFQLPQVNVSPTVLKNTGL